MGEEAKIKDILIESTARHMSVYARVVDCFTKDMDSAIMAGVPTTFTFYLDVYQRRSYWFDKKITNTVIQHTIKYDQVKKIYLVSSDRTKQTTGFQDYNAAKEAMSDLSGVDVIPITDLTKNRTYYLRMKAKLKKVQLPLHMEYIFFFVSVWDFETDWYVKEFGLK
jgi:hypothetical protein